MDNLSYLYLDIEVLADQYDMEQEVLAEINLAISN
jgi:hypothetical protein